MYFARRCRTAVLPPSKRQKAQKPHSYAVFLLLKHFVFFRVQDAFLLEKNRSLFSKFFLRAVQPAFSTVSQQCVLHCFFMCKSKRPRRMRGPLPVQNMDLRRNAGYAVISFFCVPQRPDHRRKGRLPPRTTQRQTRRPLPGSSCCCRRSQRCCRRWGKLRLHRLLCPYRCRP